MKLEVTIIGDDLRLEVGNKLTLVGIYDEAIILPELPGRLLKLAFYQRWTEVSELKRAFIEIRGSAMDISFRAEAKPVSQPPAGPHAIRISAVFGPLDILREGSIEFLNFFDDDTSPRYRYQIGVRVDPSLRATPPA